MDSGERLNGIQEVRSSILLISTKRNRLFKPFVWLTGDFLFCFIAIF